MHGLKLLKTMMLRSMTRVYLVIMDCQNLKLIKSTKICSAMEKIVNMKSMNDNHYCYKATVYETSKLIADRLNIPQDKYEVSFQSRLTNNWLEPFSDEVLKSYPAKGIKKVLVFSPAFTADCLETVIEIGHEYKELFEESGGQKLEYVESLNFSDAWVQAIIEIVNSRSG